jgi:hypothetical protein
MIHFVVRVFFFCKTLKHMFRGFVNIACCFDMQVMLQNLRFLVLNVIQMGPPLGCPHQPMMGFSLFLSIMSKVPICTLFIKYLIHRKKVRHLIIPNSK